MGERGFEPLKAYASRFTVCPLCPLGYSPGERLSLSGMGGVGKNQEGLSKAAGRTRTADLKITNHALFQLSYGGLQQAGYVDSVFVAIHDLAVVRKYIQCAGASGAAVQSAVMRLYERHWAQDVTLDSVSHVRRRWTYQDRDVFSSCGHYAFLGSYGVSPVYPHGLHQLFVKLNSGRDLHLEMVLG